MPRPHPAAVVEDGVNAVLGGTLRRRGWQPAVVPYPGYGAEGFLRVLARVLLLPTHAEPPAAAAPEGVDRRGWRNFVTAVAMHAEVVVTAGGSRYQAVADRAGMIDARIPNPGLGPGWQGVTLQPVGGGHVATARVLVVAERTRFGLVSDIDDTVLRTLLPRPMIAAYNTFVVREQSRRAVPGMAELYASVLARHPGAPTVYISTGAWNTAGTVRRFLTRHGFPAGPMLLTDWGPTNTGWFRSGREHKRACLRTLAADLPGVRWLLVGDDGQHDPSLYGQFAGEYPDRVRAIAIRQLTATEQVLAHGTATRRLGEHHGPARSVVPEVRAPDGFALAAALTGLDL